MTQNFAPTPIGKHLIAGEGVDGPEQARNRPAKGGPVAGFGASNLPLFRPKDCSRPEQVLHRIAREVAP